MNVNFLEDIGLTNGQAKTYQCLVEQGTVTAPALAKLLAESRTNTYKLLDKLVELGLALKSTSSKKIHYSPASPVALEQFVRKQSEIIRQRERRLNAELPNLLTFYFEHSERPSVRYYEGVDGLAKINKDQLITGKPIRFIRSTYDYTHLGFDELHKMRNMFPRLGITRHAIIQDILPYDLPENNQMPVAESDKAMLLTRTWIHEADYTAPVEWSVYGDKLSIVQYGGEAMGIVIESPLIADAFRQLFGLLDEGIRRRPDYRSYPKIAKYTAIPESIKSAKLA